jgi:hypothetical protein
MTNIIKRNGAYTAYPDRVVISPLKDEKIKTIKNLRDILELQGWAEVEVRFLDKKWNAAHWIDWHKTNHIIWDFVKTKYPKTNLSVESSSSMIEFDTWLCSDYDLLIDQLSIINTIKKDICKSFNLQEWPARVTRKEFEQDFVNPIHPLLMERINSFVSVSEALAWLKDISETEKISYGLDKTNIDRIPYFLSIENTLPTDIMKLTQTTSQQLTVSSKSIDHPFSKTLRLYAQTLNYLAELHKLTWSYRPRTDIRGLQFWQVVEYRSANNIGVWWWYDPQFPGIDYPKYMKKRYFPNKTKDGYTIWNMDNFIMSQWPKSLKFAVNEQWDIIPRSEFRLQDSMKNTLKAQKNIDQMFLDFINSAYAQLPMRIYEKN